MSAEVIPFPRQPLRVVSDIPEAMVWDRAADALRRRDFNEFDRILGKSRFLKSDGAA